MRHSYPSNHRRWRKIRDTIIARDGGVCHYCGQSGNSVDHLIPRSKGGTDDPTNLVCACIKCNSSKRDRMTPTFFEGQRRPSTPASLSFLKNDSTEHYRE